MTTEATPGALGSNDQLGPPPEAVRPVAYLYHDAASAEAASPMLHSTLVLMAADRRPTLRNETPLVTLAQARAMVAAERERCAEALNMARICAENNHKRADDCGDLARKLLAALNALRA